MASLVPAELLGLTDRGRLAERYRADLAVLDEALEPIETLVLGRTVWSTVADPFPGVPGGHGGAGRPCRARDGTTLPGRRLPTHGRGGGTPCS